MMPWMIWNVVQRELCKIYEVNQFLEAELALCRQLQGITTAIHRGIKLDIPDLS